MGQAASEQRQRNTPWLRTPLPRSASSRRVVTVRRQVLARSRQVCGDIRTGETTRARYGTHSDQECGVPNVELPKGCSASAAANAPPLPAPAPAACAHPAPAGPAPGPPPTAARPPAARSAPCAAGSRRRTATAPAPAHVMPTYVMGERRVHLLGARGSCLRSPAHTARGSHGPRRSQRLP